MNPVDIINEFYAPGSLSREILIVHSKAVAEKALSVASCVSHLNPDLSFIEEAAMLHDIGILFTDAPSIGCKGKHRYVCHGVLGRKLMEDKGWPRHALVCERHVGVGLTIEEIKSRNLPLPFRDMVPVTLEEQIVCYADKFFSKKNSSNGKEMPLDDVLKGLEKYGSDKAQRFMEWAKLFK
ncbi:MAG: HDIG domain-containing protein [Desulfobacterales bacterium]|jgi:uncharacterized protein|nr:HDIG domain-containing protein [Desulfobacterales bacterium]